MGVDIADEFFSSDCEPWENSNFPYFWAGAALGEVMVGKLPRPGLSAQN